MEIEFFQAVTFIEDELKVEIVLSQYFANADLIFDD